MLLFSVKDHASGTYITPFTMPTQRDAIEGFRVVTNDENTNYYKFPQDFTLVLVGEFNERTGLFDTHEPTIVVNAYDLKTKED